MYYLSFRYGLKSNILFSFHCNKNKVKYQRVLLGFSLAARLINQCGTLCIMTFNFTDYIYQGRSAKGFSVVLF